MEIALLSSIITTGRVIETEDSTNSFDLLKASFASSYFPTFRKHFEAHR